MCSEGLVTKSVDCISAYVLYRFKTNKELDLNVSVLKDEMVNLSVRKVEVEGQKTQAESNEERLRLDVIMWLDKVNDASVIAKPEEKASAKSKWLKEVEEFVTVKPGERVDKKQPLARSLNCCDLYDINEEVKRKIIKIKDLLSEADGFKNGVIDTKCFEPVKHIPGATILKGQKTTQDTSNEVRTLLNDDNIRSIGIWGLTGIGKTTLVRTLNNELKNNSTLSKLFTFVIWVDVSNKLDKDDDQCLQHLQTQIADRLNMDMEVGKDLKTMAEKLHRRLRNEKVLLILDDVWKKIDFEILGIPRLEENKGCKIILTTRFKHVCRDMGTDYDVKMNVLKLEEAEQLFRQKAKYEDQGGSRQIQKLAKKVVEECCGLPLGIDFVGRVLCKQKVVAVWQNVLNKLQTPGSPLDGIDNEVYMPLKCSYETLRVNTKKSCFIYCSLLPQGFSIETTELVKYWMGEGLIEEREYYMDSVNEGISIIEDLKGFCLLEDGDKKGTVKMHDVVRDVAIWIVSSSEDGCQSNVRSGIALGENSHPVKIVSFMNSEITKQPEPSNASTLLLQHNGSLDKVLEGFLEGFKAVRVLNLSSTNIVSLPHSLPQLRALFLRECKSLEDLSTLEELCSLQMLDLHASGIRELPIGMKKLSNLRQLDLSYTGKLKTIKARILSSLTSLQVLDMTCSAFDFCHCVKGEKEKEQTTFEELKIIDRLCDLHINLQGIPEDVSWIDRLKKFQIFIGPAHLTTTPHFTTTSPDKMVVIYGPDLTQESIKQLRSIASLESLSISYSKCQVEKCPSDPLPNTNTQLEELHLHRVSDLESIGHLGLNFHNLKSIKVSNCSDMKYVFSCGDFIRTLPSLEVIQVSSCNKLKELFNYGSGQNMASVPVVPELRILKLWRLSKLSTLSRHTETWQRLEEVDVSFCHRLIRLPLTNQNAGTIKVIRGESQWWNALEWDDNETKSSLLHYFRPRNRRRDYLRYRLYNLQDFIFQSQLSTHNKTLASRLGLGDEDFAGGKKISGCSCWALTVIDETDEEGIPRARPEFPRA